jgi:chaperonin cofactor prefoldin
MQIDQALQYDEPEELIAEMRRRANHDVVRALGALVAQRRASVLIEELRQEAERLRKGLPSLRNEATDAEQQMDQLDSLVQEIQDQLVNLSTPRNGEEERRQRALRAQHDRAQRAVSALVVGPQRAQQRVEDTIRRLITIEGHIEALQSLEPNEDERAVLEDLLAMLSERV